ncbi:MAG: rRNA maturation RNase YbeY [Candidatus Blackburnbacteria bacterium]|nr:rRNA maturation RNase YbeY [Candidatus Blackburnbacteria bacterium]
MLRIFITRQSRYPLDTKALKHKIEDVLSLRGVKDAEVSIALVGERKMRELGQKYLKENKSDPVHEVLSFSASEDGEFVVPPDKLPLGDVVICYPEARKIAIKKNKMMDDVLGELAEHGVMHLLGIHHE